MNIAKTLLMIIALILVYVAANVIVQGIVIVVFAALTMFMVSYLSKKLDEKTIAEERYRLVYDNMPMAVNIMDRNYQLTHCNNETLRMFGMKTSEE